jgi:hypothetical protein
MKISFLYSKIVVLKNCVRKFLFISSFRWYGDFFDDCNISLNRLSELLLIIKISKIRTKPNTILKLTSLAMPYIVIVERQMYRLFTLNRSEFQCQFFYITTLRLLTCQIGTLISYSASQTNQKSTKFVYFITTFTDLHSGVLFLDQKFQWQFYYHLEVSRWLGVGLGFQSGLTLTCIQSFKSRLINFFFRAHVNKT